jgi:hypothetical protein
MITICKKFKLPKVANWIKEKLSESFAAQKLDWDLAKINLRSHRTQKLENGKSVKNK